MMSLKMLRFGLCIQGEDEEQLEETIKGAFRKKQKCEKMQKKRNWCELSTLLIEKTDMTLIDTSTPLFLVLVDKLCNIKAFIDINSSNFESFN